MNEQEAKQEAQRIVEKYRDEIDMESERGYDTKDEKNLQHLGGQCALLEVQSNIDLLDKVLSKYYGHNSRLFTDELCNLKQVKAQIELL